MIRRFPRRSVQALLRPQLVALLFLGLATCLLWVKPPAANATLKTASASREIGLWVGRPLPVADRAQEVLETDDIALMEYRLGAEPPVWLAQIAGFGNRAAFHPPELCYIGSHFEVLERGPISVMVNGQPRPLMRLVIGQGGRKRFEAWYWFTANGRVTPSYYQQQAWLFMNAINRQPMSGTLVRISTPLNNPASAHRRLLAFMTSWQAATEAGASHGS